MILLVCDNDIDIVAASQTVVSTERRDLRREVGRCGRLQVTLLATTSRNPGS